MICSNCPSLSPSPPMELRNEASSSSISYTADGTPPPATTSIKLWTLLRMEVGTKNFFKVGMRYNPLVCAAAPHRNEGIEANAARAGLSNSWVKKGCFLKVTSQVFEGHLCLNFHLNFKFFR
eukprot:sb/3475921/